MVEAKDEGEPESFRKLFVGGLAINTTDESLKEFYSQFGELVDCIVMRDSQTKKSRGFGFVCFSAKEEVDKAMAARPHEIDGKKVDPKRAVPREQSSRSESNVSTKRLYVSGVREGHTEEMFRDHFSNYGTIEKIDVILDKVTQKPRGFAFVSFDDHDAVDQCILQKSHMIDGQRCDVKKALSKDEIAKAQQMDRDRQDRANRSRGGVPRGGGYAGAGYGGSALWASGSGGGWGGAQWGPPGGGYAAGYGGGYGNGANAWGAGQAPGGWAGPQQPSGGTSGQWSGEGDASGYGGSNQAAGGGGWAGGGY